MTITLDSKSFRDVAKKLDDLAAENQLTKDMYQQILEEEGFDEEEFKKTYNEYIETPDEELIQPTEITGLPVVDPIIRATGRAFGEAGRETVDFFEDVAPVTTDKVKSIFNEVADKTGEYIPESVKDFTDELFDPYHGEGIYGEAENMVGNIGSYLVPATAMVKIAKGANALAKTNRVIRGGLEATGNALGKKGRKAAKVAGFLGIGAGSATMVENPSENAVNLLREYFPESTEFLERLEIDPNDTPAKQRLDAFLNNLGLEATLVGGYLGLTNAYKGLKYIASGAERTYLGNLVKGAKAYVTARRGVKDNIIEETLKRENAPANAVQSADALARELKRLMRGFNQEQREIVNEALRTPPNRIGRVLARLGINNSPKLEELIKEMRGNIDELSKFLTSSSDIANVESPRISQNLISQFDNNLENYVQRSYNYYDNPIIKKQIQKRIKKAIPKIESGRIDEISDNIVKDASQYLLKQYGGDLEKTANIMNKYVGDNNSIDDIADFFIQNSRSADTVKNLKKKKPVPKQIRALLGEVKEADQNYIKTIEKLSTYKAEVDYLEKIAEDLITSGGAVRGVKGEVPTAARGLDNLTEITTERLEKVFGRGSVASGKVKNPLEQLYADPNYRKILGEGINDLYKQNSFFVRNLWAPVKTSAQFMATVGNPITHARNVLGNVTFMISNGMLPGAKGTYDAGKYTIAKLGNLNNRKLAEQFNKYRKLGITNTDIVTSTLKRNLGTFADDPDAYFNRRFTPREIAKFPFRKLRDVYQLEDDIFKIMHFENTKKYLRKAYPNISDTELEKLAARRTRDLLPNYSMAPRIIKGLRLAPIGDFATFAAESTRVAKNLIKYTIDDAISGNTVLTGEAAKRMAGITIAGLGADVLAEKSKMLMGITDKDDNAIRNLGPTYDFLKKHLYLSPIKKVLNRNVVDRLSLSAFDPFNYPKNFGRVIHRLANDPKFNKENLMQWGKSPELDKVKLATFDSLFSTFIAPSMATKEIIKGLDNIRDENQTEFDVLLQFLYGTFTPGIVKFILKRDAYEKQLASRDASLINKGYPSRALYSTRQNLNHLSIPGEMDIASQLGFKVDRLDLDAQAQFKITPLLNSISRGSGNKFNDLLKGKKSGFTEKLLSPQITKQDLINSKIDDEKKKIFEERELQFVLKQYLNLGYSLTDVMELLKISKEKGIGGSKFNILKKIIDDQHIINPITTQDIRNYKKFLSPLGIELPQQEINEIQDRIKNKSIERD